MAAAETDSVMDVAIIDYGSGNLRSAAKAFAWAADQAGDTRSIRVTSNPGDLRSAGHIVLPGVGAFADCMSGLNAIEGMREALEEQVIRAGKPFLGICVGMQLMADSGHEHETTKGFGWVSGKVEALAPAPNLDGRPRKIPHMGWNQLHLAGSGHPVLAGLEKGAFVYFVHGYHMVSESPADVLATAEYGQSVTAAIGRDNIVGTQFHPEKSQVPGLRLISNFLTWRP
jgi:imidazole glycerol-phosphate synthase subunit HisH